MVSEVVFCDHGAKRVLGGLDGQLGVESLDGGAESGLELQGRLVGENLVLTGFDGIHYGAHEIGRVRLGLAGVCSHRGIDVPDVDPDDVDPSGASSRRSELVADQRAALVAL